MNNNAANTPFAIRSPIEEATAALTDIQRAVALWDTGALLVLAGPGSGKTRVLTSRIARLLDASRDAKYRVLALTFTNKAADEMRERVQRLAPGFDHRMFVGTFHSFCADVLRQHGVHVGIRPDYRIYSRQEELEAVLREALQVLRQTSPDLAEEHPGLLAAIERLKKQLIQPSEAAKHIREERQRARGVAVYTAYEDVLRRHNALDFNSLILHVHELFTRFPAFAKRYRTVYPHWCVDEFQDTTSAQYEVLRVLAGGDFRNVLVVADEDQIVSSPNSVAPGP